MLRSLDTIRPFVYVPSHSVYGKPVKIRRCPATVKGDEDPYQPLRKREGGSKDEPQARRPAERI